MGNCVGNGVFVYILITMKSIKSELFEKNIVSNDQLQTVIGGGPQGDPGVDTACGAAYDGDVQYSDHCAANGHMSYYIC